MSTPPPRHDGPPPQNIAASVADISERASVLVREEIELAKAEVTEKAAQLARGAVVGAAAGVFLAVALLFILIGCAWLLYFYLPVGDFAYFWGFFGMAFILIVFGIFAGLLAARVVKRSAPPVPTMAIEEAQLIRETVSPPHHHATPPVPPVPAAQPVAASRPVAAGEPPPATAPGPPPPAENGTGGKA